MFRTITKIFVITVFFLFPISISNSISAQETSNVYFENNDLGVRILKSDLPPYFKDIDTKNWKTLSLPNEGIEFMYPPNTCVESAEFRSNIISSCDTMIIISFKGDVHLTFILSNEPFAKFADYFGFEKYLPDTSEVDSIWDYGVAGGAEDIYGDKWKGLRGYGATSQYDEGIYVGVTDKEDIFFFMDRPEKCNIIFSYYMGPNTDLCEDTEFHESSFDEYAFYKLVSSLTIKGE